MTRPKSEGLTPLQEAERQIQSSIDVDQRELHLPAELTEVPESLLRHRTLRVLYIMRGRFAKLPEWIGRMHNLEALAITDNPQLTSLPESIGDLLSLRVLYLHGNRLSTLPASVARLKKLQRLALGGNGMTSLPACIGELRQLRALYLPDNELSVLPDFMRCLSSLRELSLADNRLTVLPAWLRELGALRELYLHGNDALGLPREVLGGSRGETGTARPADILDYYFLVRAGRRRLNEAKLIVVGRGEVGKTCLVNRLVHDKFTSTSMTRGINITQWPIEVPKDTVRLHVWDFGGQEIQHATHQFFLTERSLYLVVLNGRAGAEDEDAEYWLKFIKTFGGSSPTIVVLNKFKMQPSHVNRTGLQEKYPFIRAFVQTDCKPKAGNGIAQLRAQIVSALAAMEHVRADFPAGWFEVKERLAKMRKPFISFDAYRTICAELGESDATAQERLAGHLNVLGVALNFRDDPQLREETVLNPHWITEGVYKIITSKLLV